MANLSQYDPEDIRNIILDILARLRALEQGYVVANDLAEFVDSETGTLPVTVLSDVDWSQNWKSVFVFDDFISGTIDAVPAFAQPGDLPWIAFNTTLNGGLTFANHPGVYSISDDNGAFYAQLMLLPLYDNNAFDRLQFFVQVDAPATSGDTFKFGVTDVSTYTHGVWIQIAYGDTNWQTITGDVYGTTQNDSGVAFDSSKWFFLEIKRTGTGVFEFYINQSLVATHSTNITTDSQTPIMQMDNQGLAGTIVFYIDYFGMQLAPITQRWD